MKQSKPLETWLTYKSPPNSEGAIILKKKVIMNASDHLLVLAVVVVVACIAAKADNTPTYFILGTLGNGKTELARALLGVPRGQVFDPSHPECLAVEQTLEQGCPATVEPCSATGAYKDISLTLVDTPGLGATRRCNHDNWHKILNDYVKLGSISGIIITVGATENRYNDALNESFAFTKDIIGTGVWSNVSLAVVVTRWNNHPANQRIRNESNLHEAGMKEFIHVVAERSGIVDARSTPVFFIDSRAEGLRERSMFESEASRLFQHFSGRPRIETRGATLDKSHLEVLNEMIKTRDDLKGEVSILDAVRKHIKEMEARMNESAEWNLWRIAALVLAASIALVITAFCCCLCYLKTGKIPLTCCLGKLSLGCCSPKRDMEAQVADVEIEFPAADVDIESQGVDSTYIASANSFYGDSERSTFAEAIEVESVRSAFANSVRAEVIRRMTDDS